MLEYDYYENVKNDIMRFIDENDCYKDFNNLDEMKEYLNDYLWDNDCVTGSASGSYTFNSYKAKEYVLDNMDLFYEAVTEFGFSFSEIGEKFLDEEWEFFDVLIRQYVLPTAIENAIDEMFIIGG